MRRSDGRNPKDAIPWVQPSAELDSVRIQILGALNFPVETMDEFWGQFHTLRQNAGLSVAEVNCQLRKMNKEFDKRGHVAIDTVGQYELTPYADKFARDTSWYGVNIGYKYRILLEALWKAVQAKG